MELRKSRKRMYFVTWAALVVFLILSAYFLFFLQVNSYLGIRALKVANQWQVKKILPNGTAKNSDLKVGDVIVKIDNQSPRKNLVLNQYLIVEQAHSLTILNGGTEKKIIFKQSNINVRQFLVFFSVSFIGFCLLFHFIRKQKANRYVYLFYSFIMLMLFSLIAVLPSSIGNFWGRTIVIVFISLFPIYLNLFLNRTKKSKTKCLKNKINHILVSIATFNLFLWFVGRVFNISMIFSEYLVLGLFYNLGLCLLLILVLNFFFEDFSNSTSASKVNLSLISVLSFTPLYLFYIFPMKWQVPFSRVILFTLLPLFGVFHLLILSKLVYYRYKISLRIFYLFLSVLMSMIIFLIVSLHAFVPTTFLFFYSCFLVYSFLPLIEELFFLMRRKKEHMDSLALFSAVEDEREQIAMFIHDTVIQDIIYMMKSIAENDLLLSKNETVELLDEIVFELRELCSDVYPLMIQELGLETTVVTMINQMRKKHAVTISTDLGTSALNLSHQKNNFILRSIKELINNSILHGKATEICYRSFKDSQFYYFQVKDNGNFILKQEDEKAHFGLDVIEEKTALLNGQVEINFVAGTTVTLKIPLAD